jgi:hypothetical protein
MSGSFRDGATVSWDDFHAVVQHGPNAAGSAETRRFLAEHPLYVGQLAELEKNVQALAAKLAVPDPAELSKTNITKSADGKTTTTTITFGMSFLAEMREANAKRLAQGGGVVGLYQNRGSGPLWPALCGVGLVLLGLCDGWRAWQHGRNSRQSGAPTMR